MCWAFAAAPAGDTYQGTMQHGKRHGHGKYTWGAQGAVYDGEYVDNRRQGVGTMSFPDKSRYEGKGEVSTSPYSVAHPRCAKLLFAEETLCVADSADTLLRTSCSVQLSPTVADHQGQWQYY